MRRQWLDQRETIEQAFNERIEKCQTAQDDLRFAFDAANEIQAQKNRADYETLIATQDRTRESAIQREESRMEQSITQEFQRHSREAGPERGSVGAARQRRAPFVTMAIEWRRPRHAQGHSDDRSRTALPSRAA